MKNRLLAATLAALSAVALQGCVHGHVNGETVVSDVAPDNHLHIVVVQRDWVDYKGRPVKGTVANEHAATLFPALVSRLPQDFKLNGVDASAELLAPGQQVHVGPGARTLIIQALEAWGSGGVSPTGMKLGLVLVDPVRDTIWRGSIGMGAANPGAWDASAVDHVAVPLMEQLRDARMIDISWQRPVTP